MFTDTERNEECILTEIIRVQFRNGGKTYFFDPAGFEFRSGAPVVVETSRGLELGRCTSGNHFVDDNAVVQPLKPIVRPATANDLRVEEINKKREQEAFGICEEKIAKHGLEMKLVKVECSFEGSKITFYFTADGRVDFRELVKDLAGVFRTRIELRQIGVRDEARMLGGIGICGQSYCCTRFMGEFQPVSTKMAKTQNLSLNPSKISGCCGRLMCCLRYEQEAYEDLLTRLPRQGCFVETDEGYGSVVGVNLLRQNVRVRLDGPGEAAEKDFAVEDIAEVPGGRPPEGEKPPHVLQKRERKPKAEKEDPWALPELLSGEAPAESARNEDRPNHRRNRNARSGEKKSAAPKAEGEKKPQSKKPKPQSEKKAAEPRPAPKAEGEKKPNANHRRRYRPRGKK